MILFIHELFTQVLFIVVLIFSYPPIFGGWGSQLADGERHNLWMRSVTTCGWDVLPLVDEEFLQLVDEECY